MSNHLGKEEDLKKLAHDQTQNVCKSFTSKVFSPCTLRLLSLETEGGFKKNFFCCKIGRIFLEDAQKPHIK